MKSKTIMRADDALHLVTCCRSPSWGGMEMLAVDTSRRMRERGYRVSFISHPGSPADEAARQADIDCFPLPVRGYLDPAGILRLGSWLRSQRVDVVHAHYSKDLWVLAPAMEGALSKVPLLLTKHIGTQKPKRDFLHRSIYGRVDRIIAISEVIRRNVLATHPVGPDRVITVHNGTDLIRFRKDKPEIRALRASLGIPPQAPVVGMSGRLQWWKGYREFLQTAARMADEDIYWLILGGGSIGEEAEADQIRTYAASLSLGEKLIWAGFQDDPVPYYGCMDIFAYPAYAEAFGLVIIEAMAMGVPVVAAGCDGVLEIVEDGHSGLLVEPRSTEDLTRAVTRLVRDINLRHTLGQAGRKRVERFFDVEHNIDTICTLYTLTINERRGNDGSMG